MSAASITSASRPGASGASAIGSGREENRHALGNVLRAVRVYADAAVRVVLLGEYAERSPVTRR
ncbi:hypothetical protein [Streptomyces sp. NPDC048639]|uniref:hypothetical protein n=1 Tax=Streptomyces sp. NPDC048639 TaxID=3365581 RepID=UPI0037140710